MLLIGNSHVAAPRTALRDTPARWPGFAPDFFGLPGTALNGLEIRDGILGTDRIELQRQISFYNGQPSLALTGYDAFVVIGGPNFGMISRLLQRHRCPDFPSVQAGQACDLISEGFLAAMLARRIRNSTAIRLAGRLARLEQAPILLLPEPFPSLDALAEGKSEVARLALRGDAGLFVARYLAALREEAADLSILIEQPEDTIAGMVFTAPEWMRGSLRLNSHHDIRHSQKEFGHGNAAYGGRQLDQILAVLEAL
ncbi:hypothetical protein [Paracoccus aminophilus]|uniref:hypothetical protein n=1 Tax=Paracoccus aminophilus TaxID=34003 RepID=UPI0003F865D2|nr:hypothetical protein [Paracoccus aminophilus]